MADASNVYVHNWMKMQVQILPLALVQIRLGERMRNHRIALEVAGLVLFAALFGLLFAVELWGMDLVLHIWRIG